MTNSDTSLFTAQADTPSVETLREEFHSSSEKNRLQLIDQLVHQGAAGQEVLRTFLLDYKTGEQQFVKYGAVNAVAAKVYQALYSSQVDSQLAFVQEHFPNGVVPLKSDRNVDYRPLQILLVQQNFLEADKLTNLKLCELAGEAALQRKWIYFTDVNSFPTTDLQTINALWLAHSDGKFGYSVQRELWLSVGKNWEKLWSKIAWKSGINWTRYPGQFVWTLEAPRGHLPLSNQLRGVRVIESMLTHSAWS
ncbi:MAG: GUN4 N-terminal ARM-like repeat domain-containing protein [Synechococcales bacterium]|nr:GUN4 N-terminal ARM-like repeat domain-containing protein [Synechococcales bacterium]